MIQKAILFTDSKAEQRKKYLRETLEEKQRERERESSGGSSVERDEEKMYFLTYKLIIKG